MRAIISRGLRAVTEVVTLVVCAVAMLCTVVAIPYWFGQAFGYSGAIGRNEVEAKAAASLFQCRASIAFRVTSLLVLCSLLARTLYLHLMKQRRWKIGLGRSCAEHLLFGLAWWGLLALTGVPAAIERIIASYANRVCE